MSELEIIDMHTHLQRNTAHGDEMREYFLGPALVKPGAPNRGTLDEFEDMMTHCGISGFVALMLIWSGRYYRHGLYTLPDDSAERARADEELRTRIARRVHDTNSWAAETAAGRSDMAYFAGVNPVVMGPDGAVAEIERQSAKGALGVKFSPGDMFITGSDPRLFPIYEHCLANNIPILTETGGHSPWVRPSGYRDAMAQFPELTIIFAHFGHDKTLGGPLDQEVVELAQKYQNVYSDTSLRLNEVYDGTISPADMVKHLRTLDIERTFFGTNYVFSDVLNTRPGHVDAPEDVDPRFTQVWKSVEVLKTLPLSDEERAGLAAGNFKRLTGWNPAG